MGRHFFCSFCVLFLYITTSDAVCTFPANLNGVFVESLKGQLTFTSGSVSGYTLHTFGTLTLDCFQSSGTQYVVKASTSFLYFGLSWDSYFCWNITELTSNSFYMYEISGTLTDAGNEHVKIYQAGSTPVINDICSQSSNVIGTYRFLLKQGAISSAKIRCPTQFNSYITYTMAVDGTYQCPNNDTLYDGCSDTSMMTYNYTFCSSPAAYSSSGQVYCLYSMTSGSNLYLTTYNTDATTDESSTYRYVCHILDLSTSDIVTSTMYPQQCHDNQTSTSTMSPGSSVIYTFNRTCTTTVVPVAAANIGWIIAVAVVVALVVILIIVLVALCYFTYLRDAKARERKVIDIRAAEEADMRAKEDTGERGRAAPHMRIRFPDYTRRKVDRWRRDIDTEDGRPLSPTGIHFQSKTDRDSPDSAFGSIDDDDELAILRKPKPVSDFMKRLISLHDQKKEAAKEKAKLSADVHFRRQQGRKGFQNESELIGSHGPALVTKIKSMARRKKRKTADIYQTDNAVKNMTDQDAEEGDDEPDVGVDKAELEPNEKADDSMEGDLPSELNVNKLLAYTALAPSATDFKRGTEAKKSKNKGVTIAERKNEEIIVEDLEDHVARKHAGGFVSDSGVYSPTSDRVKDRSGIFTVQSHEVTPNMKIRTHGRRDSAEDEMMVRCDNILQRIHKKPKTAFDIPDVEKTDLLNADSLLRRRLGEDRWRKLLEEIYPDKKYMDYAQDTSRPTEDFLFKRVGQGLDYLYNRAEYWGKQDPITRPQTTARCSRAKSSRSVRNKSRASSAGLSRNKSLSAKQTMKDKQNVR